MKNCNVCKKVLTSKNTHVGVHEFICKSCENKERRERYYKNREKHILRVKTYNQTEKGKEINKKKQKRRYLKYPEQWKARAKLRYLVITGKVIKPDTCLINQNCAGRIEAHHYLGYEVEHWKDVQWLCTRHHRFTQRKHMKESHE